MTRLKGPGGTPPWVWGLLALLVLAGVLLGLDYLDLLPLGVY